MKTYMIVILAVLAGGFLIWLGIKTKSLVKILGGIGTILGGLLIGTTKRVNEQKEELKKKDEEIAMTKKAVEEVHYVQEEIKKVKDETPAPETKTPAAPGDSQSRLDRLNKLHQH